MAHGSRKRLTLFGVFLFLWQNTTAKAVYRRNCGLGLSFQRETDGRGGLGRRGKCWGMTGAESWGGGVAVEAGGWSRKLQTRSEERKLKVGEGYKFSKTTLYEIIPLPKGFTTSQRALTTRDHVFTRLHLPGTFLIQTTTGATPRWQEQEVTGKEATIARKQRDPPSL